MPPSRLRPLVSFDVALRSTPSYCAPHIPHRPSSTSTLPPDAPITASLPARWLTDLKRRIGKCIIFGLKEEQIDEAGEILRVVASDWRELLAGSEGFLTGKGRAGLERRDVVWGEMVSLLSWMFGTRM